MKLRFWFCLQRRYTVDDLFSACWRFLSPGVDREVIVVEDARPTNTRKRLQEFVADSRLSSWSCTKEPGKGAAIRSAVQHATGTSW